MREKSFREGLVVIIFMKRSETEVRELMYVWKMESPEFCV